VRGRQSQSNSAVVRCLVGVDSTTALAGNTHEDDFVAVRCVLTDTAFLSLGRVRGFESDDVTCRDVFHEFSSTAALFGRHVQSVEVPGVGDTYDNDAGFVVLGNTDLGVG